MIHVIGKKRIAAGLSGHILALVKEDSRVLDFHCREILQHSPLNEHSRDEPIEAKVIASNCRWMTTKGLDGEFALLTFRNVDRHCDRWQKVRVGRRFFAPAFLHHVLHGQATIRVGRKTVKVRKGDVFVMDMNVDHEVTSRSLCCTALVTVARKDYRTLEKARGMLGMAA